MEPVVDDADHPPPGMPPEQVELRTKWMAEQLKLAKAVVLDDGVSGFKMPWSDENVKPAVPGAVVVDKKGKSVPTAGAATLPPLTLVGGLDISFVKDTSIAVASLVVLTYPELKVVRTLMHHCEMKLPYMAGFLAFREVGPLQYVIDKCKKDFPKDVPQILFIDGNGVLHYRRCGLASHLGVVVDIPCVGSAKNLLVVDGVTRDEVKAHFTEATPEKRKEPYPLIGKTSKDTLGYAALTGNSTAQPIYISAGHRITQYSATKLVLSMCGNRVPEPIRQADLLSRQYLKENMGKVNPDDATTLEVKMDAKPVRKAARSTTKGKKPEAATATAVSSSSSSSSSSPAGSPTKK